MKYPVNGKSFEVIRKDGYVYVDKTAWIHKLVSAEDCYFLSRPRRFGKTLLVSTMKAYFQGKKDLFTGLKIEKLEKDWTEYPVLHIDFNIGQWEQEGKLQEIIENYLDKWEIKYGKDPIDKSAETRFAGIIRRAYEKKGRKVVILVDEYDKPLLDTMDAPELHKKTRSILGAFYAVLKSQIKYIRFALLTGVTKFSKVSIFSGMNNFKDISLEETYADICGITEEELHRYFDDEIKELARTKGKTFEDVCGKLKNMYDGYLFAGEGARVYNPYSVLITLDRSKFSNYWYETGTPSFLIKLMSDENFNLLELNGKIEAETLMSVDDLSNNEVVPVLYQSGYLTIKEWDKETQQYILGFPNGEVRESFVKHLLTYYLGIKKYVSQFVSDFAREVRGGQPEAFLTRLKGKLEETPYKIIGKREIYYQNSLSILFGLVAGATVIPEDFTTNGRIDITLKTDKYIYVMELKLNGSAKKALAQINEKQYHLKYLNDGRKIFKIGINCSSKEKNRNIDTWLIEEVPGT